MRAAAADTVRLPGRAVVGAAALAALTAAGAGAQSGVMPSTLRYGSGHWDVPVAHVLPHLAVTATYSGFSLDTERLLVDESGDVVGRDGSLEAWKSDGSVALGLLDRFEVGATVQSFAGEGSGGTMAGGFARLLILRPDPAGGFGLAGGVRYVSAPSFDGAPRGADFQPGRLGFPDRRLRRSYPGKDEVSSVWSPYVVGSALLPGFDARLLPTHDVTLSLGWGGGIFSDGGDLEDWYASGSSGGWFFGGALRTRIRGSTVLNVIGDYNGFDVNVGAQLDVGGIRIGGFVLGVNHDAGAGPYRSRKVGVLASVALCPGRGGLCRPGLLERSRPDTIRIPAPPPDTVVVEREPDRTSPGGEAASLCLATGRAADVRITARGDTLVGPGGVPISSLRPGLAFAGTYAGGRSWFAEGRPIELGGRTYRRSPTEAEVECGAIERVGEHEGVPLFAPRDAGATPPLLWVPVRPGLWRRYDPASPGEAGFTGAGPGTSSPGGPSGARPRR